MSEIISDRQIFEILTESPFNILPSRTHVVARIALTQSGIPSPEEISAAEHLDLLSKVDNIIAGYSLEKILEPEPWPMHHQDNEREATN